MDIGLALAQLIEVTNSISTLVTTAGQISAIVQKANSEGRTTLTPDEWAVVRKADDDSRQGLVQAIQKALLAEKLTS